MGQIEGRLAPECAIYSIWCHLGRVGSVQLEVGWRRSALYVVFGASGGGLGGCKWMSNGLGMGWASTAPSLLLKPPGAPRLEATTPLVDRAGFILLNLFLITSRTQAKILKDILYEGVRGGHRRSQRTKNSPGQLKTFWLLQ